MNRQMDKGASVWLPDKCFELYVQSPYSNASSYQTFVKGQTPRCRVAN